MKKLIAITVVIALLAFTSARLGLPTGHTVKYEDVTTRPDATLTDLVTLRAYLAVAPPEVKDYGVFKISKIGDTEIVAIPYVGWINPEQ